MTEKWSTKNKEWETQAQAIASSFTLAPIKTSGGRWHAVMVNTRGEQFDNLYSHIVVEAGVFGQYKTKSAAAAHVLSSGEARHFLRACFNVAEHINPFAPESGQS
jgi:hypothetical protein